MSVGSCIPSLLLHHTRMDTHTAAMQPPSGALESLKKVTAQEHAHSVTQPHADRVAGKTQDFPMAARGRRWRRNIYLIMRLGCVLLEKRMRQTHGYGPMGFPKTSIAYKALHVPQDESAINNSNHDSFDTHSSFG